MMQILLQQRLALLDGRRIFLLRDFLLQALNRCCSRQRHHDQQEDGKSDEAGHQCDSCDSARDYNKDQCKIPRLAV